MQVNADEAGVLNIPRSGSISQEGNSMASRTVFLVVHTHTDPVLFAGRSDKLIGIFSSESEAVAAINGLSQLEGFKEVPEGFVVHSVELDSPLTDPIELWE